MVLCPKTTRGKPISQNEAWIAKTMASYVSKQHTIEVAFCKGAKHFLKILIAGAIKVGVSDGGICCYGSRNINGGSSIWIQFDYPTDTFCAKSISQVVFISWR